MLEEKKTQVFEVLGQRFDAKIAELLQEAKEVVDKAGGSRVDYSASIDNITKMFREKARAALVSDEVVERYPGMD